MKKIIIFIDNDCVFCNKFSLLCLRYEKKSDSCLYFSGLDSDYSKILFHKFNYLSDKSTVVCFKNNQIFERSEAIVEIAKNLKFPFSLFRMIRIFPIFLREEIYKLISKNRYLFGKRESCEVIPPQYKERYRVWEDLKK